ncbi:MAG: cysteine synthase family protein [Anaerolineae bacterium]|nr:cysteine synthase family protein [Thermoflexales bacterium]MDW8408639.1 cysteine synthase family protein [Anaerolineae bacterium]
MSILYRSSSCDLCLQVGNTPLVRLERLEGARRVAPVEVYAKAEWFNPSGSVKDRAALNIICTAEADGRLTRDKIILDATSGNMGIAYAMLGAALGYRVRLVMPLNVSPERKFILKAYGAEMVFTDPMLGGNGAVRKAQELYHEDPHTYFYANQYDNDANWQAHYYTTAEEIWRQTEGRITHFVTGLGTSGTFMGVGRRLRELNPDIRLISLQPDSAVNAIEGWKYMPTAILPRIYDPSLADENLEIETEAAQEMAIRLAREQGLFVSPSAGAAAVGALRVAERVRDTVGHGVVVTVFADAGYKYMSEDFWHGG